MPAICIVMIAAGFGLWLLSYHMRTVRDKLASYKDNFKQGNLNNCMGYKEKYELYNDKYRKKNDEKWGKDYLDHYRYEVDFMKIDYVHDVEELKSIFNDISKKLDVPYKYVLGAWYGHWSSLINDIDLNRHIGNLTSNDFIWCLPIEEQLNKAWKMFSAPSLKKLNVTRDVVKKMFDMFVEARILKCFTFTWTEENLQDMANRTWEIEKREAIREGRPGAHLLSFGETKTKTREERVQDIKRKILEIKRAKAEKAKQAA